MNVKFGGAEYFIPSTLCRLQLWQIGFSQNRSRVISSVIWGHTYAEANWLVGKTFKIPKSSRYRFMAAISKSNIFCEK